ncbi:MAG: 16S rRNA (uracil(1498)-N(3))-methyltransferase [Bacteroidales bacterium]|nr:16S rRNA (uracil(1498)-N(3))-methyltransferase [Bacteroidales bacterium]
MQLFYSHKLEAGIFTFDENESKHIIKVLRHRTGDTIYVTNGKGAIYRTGIISADPLQCKAEVTGTMSSFNKHDYYLHIAIAPTKNSDRMEWFVEKAVELGIDEISPLVCEHSERRKINKERLQKITVSAMKQSFKSHLTKINDIVSFADFIKIEFNGKKFIAHLDSEIRNNSLAANYLKGENVLFLIGPEGDFSREEVNQAIRNDYLPTSLGRSRLRTETAGLTACCWVYYINQ